MSCRSSSGQPGLSARFRFEEVDPQKGDAPTNWNGLCQGRWWGTREMGDAPPRLWGSQGEEDQWEERRNKGVHARGFSGASAAAWAWGPPGDRSGRFTWTRTSGRLTLLASSSRLYTSG